MSPRVSAFVRDPHRRLILLIIGLVTIAFCVGLMVLKYLQRELIQRAGDSMAVVAVGLSGKIDRIFFERFGDIHMLARAFGPQMNNPSSLTTYLHWMQNTYHVYRWLGVTDAAGHIIAATDPATVGQDQSGMSWFQAAKSRGIAISEDVTSHAMIDGRLATAFAAPIIDATGTFKGVVVSLVGLPVLGEMIQHMGEPLQAQIDVPAFEYIVVRQNGDVIGDSLLQQEGEANLKSLPSVEWATTSDVPGFVEELSPRRHVPTVTGYARTRGFQDFSGFGWGILVRVPREAVLAPITRLTNWIMLAGVLGFLPLVGLMLWTATRLRASERALRQARMELEARVEDRTRDLRESEAQLQKLNATLDAQVKDRTAALLMKQQQLRALSLELSRTETRERKRLAAELHDNLAQTLAVCKMRAIAALTGPTDRFAAMQTELISLLGEALSYTRMLMLDLRPMFLGDEGDLSTAIYWVIKKMQRYGLVITLEDNGKPKRLDEEVLTVTYQAIHELLWNVVKHAGSKRADVSFRQSGEFLEATVTDRGKGFNPSAHQPSLAEGGFGLLNIRERVEALGGCLEITSGLDQGTSAKLIVPLKGDSTTGIESGQPESPSRPTA